MSAISSPRERSISTVKTWRITANMLPPPDRPTPFPVDREAALKAEGLLATG